MKDEETERCGLLLEKQEQEQGGQVGRRPAAALDGPAPTQPPGRETGFSGVLVPA